MKCDIEHCVSHMSLANKMACKRYYGEHKKEKRAYQHKYNAEIKELINRVKGTRCNICGQDTIRIILHEKTGKKHPLNYWFYKSEYKKNQLEPYARLCNRCHVMVHWIAHILKERNKDQQDKIVTLAEKFAKIP